MVAGEDVTGIRGARRRRLRCESIGTVYQTPQQGLDFSLTAGGNVASTMLGAGWRSFGRVRERALAYHVAMELPAERFDVPVELFSGGMRQLRRRRAHRLRRLVCLHDRAHERREYVRHG